MLECKLCKCLFKNLNGLSAHITKKHKDVSQQEYYDTYIDQSKNHICPTCGKPTKFLSIGYGYKTHCNKICANKDNQIITQRHTTLDNTYGHPFSRPEVLAKCRKTIETRYGVSNSFCLPIAKENAHSKKALAKHYNTMKKNKTFKVSKQEDKVYSKLVDIFGENDVERNYYSEKYPFRCDFYIKSLDLYIECNFHWTHGGIPYDGRKSICRKQLAMWKEKAKTSKYYKNAIHTWTIRDVNKYKCAKKNKLNYIVLWKLEDTLTWKFN